MDHASAESGSVAGPDSISAADMPIRPTALPGLRRKTMVPRWAWA